MDIQPWLMPLMRRPSPATNDPGRERCQELAFQQGLRLFEGHNDAAAQAAAEHLATNGFVVLLDALEVEDLLNLRTQSVKVISEIVFNNPKHLRRGDHNSTRFSMGRTTDICYLSVADNRAVCNVLQHFWDDSDDEFAVQCTGGDFSLPGALEQKLHTDVRPGAYSKVRRAPEIKVYFPLVDFDDHVGPTRFIRASQGKDCCPVAQPVLAFCPARSAIMMDMRIWHGGTANLSQSCRPMVSIHYASGSDRWFHQTLSVGSLSSLSDRGKHLCRRLVTQGMEEWSIEEWNTLDMSGSNLTLHSAWFADPNFLETGVDVTARLKQLLSKSSKAHINYKSLGIDPAPHKVKKLFLKLRRS